jgi:site-specific recombinase XerD
MKIGIYKRKNGAYQVSYRTSDHSFPRTAVANARTINLSSRIFEFLQSHPKIAVNVFLNGKGRAWTGKTYYRAMVIDRNAIGHSRHWDCFSFRHSFAYHFLRSGKTLHQLQVVIGHRHIEDTIRAYGDIERI